MKEGGKAVLVLCRALKVFINRESLKVFQEAGEEQEWALVGVLSALRLKVQCVCITPLSICFCKHLKPGNSLTSLLVND